MAGLIHLVKLSVGSEGVEDLRALRGLPGAQILNAFAANAQLYQMD